MKNVWELLTMFMRKFVGEHFRMFHWNFLKCSWTFKKFQNVPLELFKIFLNIQKVPEHVCKHFKSKCRVKKCLRTNSKIFWKKVLKGSICLHFTKVLKNVHQIIQIVYNVSNIPYLFGNNSKCSQEKFPKNVFHFLISS